MATRKPKTCYNGVDLEVNGGSCLGTLSLQKEGLIFRPEDNKEPKVKMGWRSVAQHQFLSSSALVKVIHEQGMLYDFQMKDDADFQSIQQDFPLRLLEAKSEAQTTRQKPKATCAVKSVANQKAAGQRQSPPAVANSSNNTRPPTSSAKNSQNVQTAAQQNLPQAQPQAQPQQQQSPPPNNTNTNSPGVSANNRVSLLVQHKPLLLQGLVANVIFGIGAIALLIFSTLELNGRERDAAALGSYMLAFVCFLLNALLEFYIDVTVGERKVRHGRYSTKKYLNWFISGLFVLGVVLDLVAFFLWIDRQFVTEHRVLYAASHAWLVTAIIVLVGQVPFQTRDVLEGLDDVANILFLVGSAMDCVVRYVDTDLDTGSPPEAVARLEFSSSPFYLVGGFCYIAADSLRVRIVQQNKHL